MREILLWKKALIADCLWSIQWIHGKVQIVIDILTCSQITKHLHIPMLLMLVTNKSENKLTKFPIQATFRKRDNYIQLCWKQILKEMKTAGWSENSNAIT